MDLLERSSELDQLASAFERTRGGSGSVVFIRGEAGIGKTALVSAFLAAHSGDADALVGACDDLSAPQPLGPFWDMAAGYPELQAALRPPARRVHDAVRQLLSGRRRPAIMVIEDLHWADDATLDLVRFLGRRIEAASCLLLLTFRDDAARADGLRRLVGDLPAASVERLKLLPLSQATVQQLVSQSGAREDLYDVTHGNPFLVTEMLHAGSSLLPPTLVDAVLARVSRLAPPARDLVELVSVVPGRATRSLVESEVDSWSGAMDDAEGAGLLTATDGYVLFRHELARQAVEEALPSGRRVDLHRRVLRQLQKESGDRARQIHHALHADDDATLRCCVPPAAEEAMAAGSYREAYRYFGMLHRMGRDGHAVRAGRCARRR